MSIRALSSNRFSVIYSRVASECGHGLEAGQTVGGATGGADSGGRKGWGTASAKKVFFGKQSVKAQGPELEKGLQMR